jgi:hypothetical protein
MKTRAFGLAFLVIAAAIQLATGSPARASTFVYTGNDFTTTSDPTLGKNVTLYVIFDDSVSTQSGTLTDSDKILLWSISTGKISIDSSSGTLSSPSFTFDTGHIDTWDFSASSPGGTYTIQTKGNWSGTTGTGMDLVMTGNVINSNSDNPDSFYPATQSFTELQGTWNSNTMASAPAGPFWEKDTMTVDAIGTLDGSGVLSNGHTGNISGAFMRSPNGLLVTYGVPDNTLCQTDVNNTVFACTGSGAASYPELAIGLKQATSYAVSDLVGTWSGVMMAAGQSPSWLRSTRTIDNDGKFTGSQIDNKKVKESVSGQFSISTDTNTLGLITCVSGCNGASNFSMVMDAGKTVMAGTSTGPDGATPQQWVYTKNAASYSLTDLTGTWELNALDSGAGAGWQRAAITVDRHGKFTGSFTDSNGITNSKKGTMSISSTGAVSCTPNCPSPMYMDSGKSIMAYAITAKVPSGPALVSTPEIGILTKDPLTISGTAVTTNSSPMTGVYMTLSQGSRLNEIQTGSDGTFSWGGLQNGKYTVKTNRPGYTITPKSIAVTLMGQSVTNLNFAFTPITISGQIIPFTGKKLGASLTVIDMTGNGVTWPSITMNSDGAYSFPGVPNAVYTITATSLAHNGVTINGSTIPEPKFSPATVKVSIAGKSAKVNFKYKTDSTCSKCH